MTVAYQLTSAGTSFTRTTVERRPLGPRDVHLDLQFCGICHSDLVAASNKLGGGMYPMVPGHEMVGIVTEVGADVEGVSVGDAVGVGCIADSCRVCRLASRRIRRHEDCTPLNGKRSNGAPSQEAPYHGSLSRRDSRRANLRGGGLSAPWPSAPMLPCRKA